MGPSKQNLYLFLEKNEQQNIIDQKLVLLYANRCVDEENAQFEISGVFELQHVSELMYERSNPMYKMEAVQRAYKEANDRYTISEAFEKAHLNESKSIDSHFIIGSSFHSLSVQWPTVIDRTRSLVEWMIDELKSLEIKTAYVTLLAGGRGGLLTKKMNTVAYDGKMRFDLTTPFARDKPIPIRPKFSVNDVFELSISLIRRGRRLKQNMHLFLHPMLTQHQLKLIERKDESYLRTFGNHLNGRGLDICREELKFLGAFPDSNPRIRFVRCFCIRRTFYFE